MKTIDCNTCRTALQDLLLEPGYAPAAETEAHLHQCTDCRAELADLQATMAMLDDWTAPEPSPYFDARVRAHLREAEPAAPASLWERLTMALHLGSGRGLRTAVAGVFVFVLLLGGGTVATLWGGHHPASPTAQQSPAINDLRIMDNNAQALQQLDLLDDQGTQQQAPAPQS